MAANEASRLRSEHAQPRAEEGSAARPLVRELSSEVTHGKASEADAESAEPSSEALAALERAAENIRPSWHGAQLPPYAPSENHAALPAALPPPPALPAFSSFPIEQDAPHYRADSTVRTAAVLPERLAQLLSPPHFADTRNRALRLLADASHWLRERPLARGGMAATVVLLLASWLWPSAPETPPKTADRPRSVNSAPAMPAAPVPAPRAVQEPPFPPAESDAVAAKQPDPEPPSSTVKKRDKRKATVKATAVKAPTIKAAVDKPAAAKAPIDKPVAAKARKPARDTTAPTR